MGWRRACFCVRSRVGVRFTKCLSLQKVPDTFSRFLVSLKSAEKPHFLPKVLQQRSYGASSVTVSRESVQVTGTNTIFHLVQEQAFELTLYVA